MLGVAVSTAVPAVGALCPYVQAGVCAVSAQSWVNPYLAIEARRLMAGGTSATAALDAPLRCQSGPHGSMPGARSNARSYHDATIAR
jgi:uncharacterized Ntn-hydrolase superfamily protein